MKIWYKSPILIITLVYITLFLLMLPLREVSFLDDFLYIQTVENFINTGNLKISDWASTALVFPVLWGALFSKIFGFSIKTLHISNIVLSYFGIIAFYFILIEFKLEKFKSTIFTLFLLSYPWIFSYIYSFMSDTFYLSTLLLSILFYLRGFHTNKLIYYMLGSLFAGLAFLTRQIAITIPISVLIIFFLRIRILKNLDLKTFLAATIPSSALMAMYYLWIKTVGLSAAYYIFFYGYSRTQIIPKLFPESFIRISTNNLLYIDLLLLRPSVYLSSLAIHLLPVFLIFKVNLIQIKKYLFKNYSRTLIITILIGLFCLALKFSSFSNDRYPNEIFPSSGLFIYLKSLWPYLAFLSLPFWIFVIAVISRLISSEILQKRKSPAISPKLLLPFLILIFGYVYLNSTLGVFSGYFRDIFEVKNLSFFERNLNILTGFMEPKIFLGVLKEIWLILILLLIVLTLIYLFVVKVRIRINKKINLSITFVVLILIGHFGMTNILAYTHWEEYTIPWIPLILILLLYITRDLKLLKIPAVVIISLLIMFSLQATRERYQRQGVIWEMGFKLVEEGVDPHRIYDIQTLGTWRLYWFWEEEFQKFVREKKGGEKYKVQPTEFNPVSMKILDGDIYMSIPIDSNYSKFDKQGEPILTESYWILNEKVEIEHRKFGFIKSVRDSRQK